MKNKKIVIIMGLVILLLIGVIAYLLLKPEKPEEKKTVEPSADALKFKKEYEALNGTIRESDGATYNSVVIPENNPIEYVDTKEALEILKNKTAVIYVGAEWCPWCRGIIPILFDVAKENHVDTIYYLNLDDEKDSFEVQKGKLVKTVDGTEGYYELLEFLSDELKDYVITSDGKEYKTGEKRIYMPFVLVCKNGKIEATHTGSVTLDKNQTKYDALTDKQVKEVYAIYTEMFRKIIAKGTCNDDCN